MIKAIIFDFSRVILKPADKSYSGGLNDLHRSISSTLNYYLFNHFELNRELLGYLDKIKNKYALYIFTNGVVQNEPEIKKELEGIFKKVFTLDDFGDKRNPGSYKRLLEYVGAAATEAIFVDDSLGNTQSAQEAGLKTIQYSSNQQLFEDLEGVFS